MNGIDTMTDGTDDDIRAAIRGLGEGVDPSPGMYEGIRQRHVRSRRRRVATLAVAAVMVGGGGTAVAADGLGVLKPALTSTSAGGGAEIRAKIPDYGATRGSLAGDAAFLAALPEQTRKSLGGSGDAYEDGVAKSFDLAGAQVLFAGDVPGERRALVVSTVETRVGLRPVYAWLAGEAGASVTTLSISMNGVGDARHYLPEVFSWSQPLSETRHNLVVVAPRGARIELSRRPIYTADGNVERRWERLPTQDGVATVDLPGVKVAGLSLRVTVAGTVKYLGRPGGRTSYGNPAISKTQLATVVAGARGTVDAALAGQAIGNLRGEMGLLPTDVVDLKVVWGGPVDGAKSVVVTGRDKVGGGTVALAVEDGRASTMYAARPAGKPYPLAWLGQDREHVAVVGPAGATKATVRGAGWTRDVILEDGVGVVKVPKAPSWDDFVDGKEGRYETPSVTIEGAGSQPVGVYTDHERTLGDPKPVEAVLIAEVNESDDQFFPFFDDDRVCEKGCPN